MEVLKREIRELEAGSHPEFKERLKELEKEKQQLTEKANRWKEYQLQCAEAAYKEEREQAEQEYRTEKEGLKERLLAQIEERKRKLQEDKEALTIDNDLPTDTSSRLQPRKLRKRNPIEAAAEMRAAKRKQPQGASLNERLKDTEIMDDLMQLSKVRSNFWLTCSFSQRKALLVSPCLLEDGESERNTVKLKICNCSNNFALNAKI